MEKVGQVFRQTREAHHIPLRKAAQRLGIQEKFLLAIESDCYSDLPNGLYPELYVGKYARFLGLTEEKMVALFRRDYLVVPKKMLQKSTTINLPSRWREFILAIGIVLLFVFYLLYQLTRN